MVSAVKFMRHTLIPTINFARDWSVPIPKECQDHVKLLREEEGRVSVAWQYVETVQFFV